ncbi:hypothetical protein V8F20_001352 [Naviculisporaceae sp. PSN 640]
MATLDSAEYLTIPLRVQPNHRLIRNEWIGTRSDLNTTESQQPERSLPWSPIPMSCAVMVIHTELRSPTCPNRHKPMIPQRDDDMNVEKLSSLLLVPHVSKNELRIPNCYRPLFSQRQPRRSFRTLLFVRPLIKTKLIPGPCNTGEERQDVGPAPRIITPGHSSSSVTSVTGTAGTMKILSTSRGYCSGLTCAAMQNIAVTRDTERRCHNPQLHYLGYHQVTGVRQYPDERPPHRAFRSSGRGHHAAGYIHAKRQSACFS